jgi:hypothetical protein
MAEKETHIPLAEVAIEIETHDRALEFDLMGNPAFLEKGVALTLPDGSRLAWQPGPMRKAYGLPQILRYVLEYGSGVSAGILASYLYEKLKGRATVLRVDRQEIQIEQGEITRIITEHIEKSD